MHDHDRYIAHIDHIADVAILQGTTHNCVDRSNNGIIRKTSQEGEREKEARVKSKIIELDAASVHGKPITIRVVNV